MSYTANPSIVTNGLVYCLDAASPRSYSGGENLMNYSTYNAGTWSLPNGFGTLTSGIDAPDGTNTAVRLISNNGGNTLLRVTHPTVSPSGSDYYTISFWVRYISGNSANSNQLTSDWSDTNPSVNFLPLLVQNEWVRVVFSAIASAGARTFLDVLSDRTNNYTLDFWGVQIEKSQFVTPYTPTTGTPITRGTSWNDIISGTGSVGATSNTAFVSSGQDAAFQFTGGSTSFITTNTYAGLNLTNNLTLEAWCRVDVWRDFGGLLTFGTDAGEQYALWPNSNGYFAISWNWPANWQQVYSAQVPTGTATGKWFHVVGTFGDNAACVYVNGALSGRQVNLGIPISAVSGAYLTLGNNHPGGDEMFTGLIGVARVYNRALSAQEVTQNFAALRGRYGI